MLKTHLKRVHGLSDLSDVQLKEIQEKARDVTEEASSGSSDKYIKPKRLKKNKRKRKGKKERQKEKERMAVITAKEIRKTEAINLIKEFDKKEEDLKGKRRKEKPIASKSKPVRMRGVPILSPDNNYPIVNCRSCGEEVFLVPVKFKNGGQGTRKHDINPFQPHNCEWNYPDPLDDPKTLRIFQPKSSKYRK